MGKTNGNLPNKEDSNGKEDGNRVMLFWVGYWPRPATAPKSSVVVNALLLRVLKYGKKWRRCYSLCGVGIALY